MRSRAAAALCSAALLLGAPAARAQAQSAASAQSQRVARAKGEEALGLYNGGRWAEAYGRFHEADQLFHAPTLVLYMAHCQRNLGKLIAASALYQQLVDEPVPAGAPDQFRKAQATAKSSLEQLRGRLPSVVVVVTGVPEGRSLVSVDGGPPLPDGRPIDVDPGEHTISITPPSGAPVTRTLTAKEGTVTPVDITIAAPVGAPRPPPAAVSPPSPSPFSRPGVRLAFGVGAASLAIGLGTGAISLAKTGDLKPNCSATGHCPSQYQSDYSAASALATISTITTIVGVAGLGAGTFLVLRPASPDAPAVQATVGPGSLMLSGRF